MIKYRLVLCTLIALSACSSREPINISLSNGQPCFSAGWQGDEPYFLGTISVADASDSSKSFEERVQWDLKFDDFKSPVNISTENICVVYGGESIRLPKNLKAKPLRLNTPYEVFMNAYTKSGSSIDMYDQFCLAKENNQLFIKEALKEGGTFTCSNNNFSVRKRPMFGLFG